MAQTEIVQAQGNPALPEKWRPDWGRHVETIARLHDQVVST